MMPMEWGLCQPLIALEAGINEPVGDDSGVCMQPPDELATFTWTNFFLSNCLHNEPWFGISYRMSISKPVVYTGLYTN